MVCGHRGRGRATLLAAALAIAAVVAAGPAPAAAAGPDPRLPGNAVVEPNISYMLARFRTQGNADLQDCSELCQVEIDCIAWVWNKPLRICQIGFEMSALPPLRPFEGVSGQPATVFEADSVDCTSEVRPGVALVSLNQRTSNTKTVGQCALKCAEARGCVAFTWTRTLQLCAVKFSLTGATLPSRPAISGIAGPCGAGSGGGGSGSAPLGPGVPGGPGGPGVGGPGAGGPGGFGLPGGAAFAGRR